MVENLILHRDGLPSSTCRTGLSPKGGSDSTERGYRLAEGSFCFPKDLKPNLQNVIEQKTKKCPYCAEEILAEAIKCKHCKSDLSEKKPACADSALLGQKASASVKEGLFLRTLNCGCVAVFIVIALVLGILSMITS